jgi:hypothetical protein
MTVMTILLVGKAARTGCKPSQDEFFLGYRVVDVRFRREPAENA